MTTKQDTIKPATPLPWAQTQSAGFSAVSGRVDPVCTTSRALDSAYIVAAANACPLLVEALRDAMHKVPDPADCRKIQDLLVSIGAIK